MVVPYQGMDAKVMLTEELGYFRVRIKWISKELSKKTKIQVYETLMLSIILYKLETRTLKETKKIEMLINMLDLITDTILMTESCSNDLDILGIHVE